MHDFSSMRPCVRAQARVGRDASLRGHIGMRPSTWVWVVFEGRASTWALTRLLRGAFVFNPIALRRPLHACWVRKDAGTTAGRAAERQTLGALSDSRPQASNRAEANPITTIGYDLGASL